MRENILEKPLPLKVILVWGFGLVCAVVGATAFVMEAVNRSQVNALTVQLDAERRRVAEPQSQLAYRAR